MNRCLPALGLLVCLAGTAHAQVPIPRVTDTYQRSGLLTRRAPVRSTLPVDGDRDKWYNTYWGDHPKPLHQKNVLGSNSPNVGGLYGLPLRNCAVCNYPNFNGAPGGPTNAHVCTPQPKGLRLFTSAFHQGKPVCYYYAGGCYVPVYDLDYFVPGPGPFPYKDFFKRTTGG